MTLVELLMYEVAYKSFQRLVFYFGLEGSVISMKSSSQYSESGDNTAPCLTPLLLLYMSDNESPHRTCMGCFLYILNNKRNIKGHTARSDNSLKSSMWYNLSNALEASMYDTYIDEWHGVKY